MANIQNIQVIDLTKDQISPYGKIISPNHNQPPDIEGDNWKCWYPLGELQSDYTQIIGMVNTEPSDKIFQKMEKHPNRSEWVFAIDKPYIQVVALSSSKTGNMPDQETVKAFLVRPGQGILISKDVWHAPGITAYDEPSLYGFVLGKPQKVDEDIELGLVSFENDIALKCIMRP